MKVINWASFMVSLAFRKKHRKTLTKLDLMLLTPVTRDSKETYFSDILPLLKHKQLREHWPARLHFTIDSSKAAGTKCYRLHAARHTRRLQDDMLSLPES